MNQAELIEKIAVGADLTKAEANKVIDAFASTIIKTLYKGGRVTIKDFGAFMVTNKAAL